MSQIVRSVVILSVCFLLIVIQRLQGQTGVEGKGYMQFSLTLDEVGGGDGALNEAFGGAGYSTISSTFINRLAVGLGLDVRPARIPFSIGMEFSVLPNSSNSPQLAGLFTSVMYGYHLYEGERLNANVLVGAGFGNGSVNLTPGDGRGSLSEQLIDTTGEPRVLTFEAYNLIIGAGVDYAIPYSAEQGLDLTVGLRGRMNVIQSIHARLNGRNVVVPSGTSLPAYQIGLALGWRFGL